MSGDENAGHAERGLFHARFATTEMVFRSRGGYRVTHAAMRFRE
jgi:hypothetical protein